MNDQSIQRGISCPPRDINCTKILESMNAWNDSEANAYRLVDLPPIPPTEITVKEASHAFPTVDVPDHVHYTIGAVILAVGITGMLGNFLVIYAFCRSRSLRTPANIFIINLAISDFLMSVTQAPTFFATSLHKRWIFGEKGCELYAFCGAIFGITSMITLTVISVDRYFVITRPLASIGMMSKKRAVLILLGVWLYSLAWSLPPFFGWSAYVPEGLLTSCTWDYMTFTPSVRAYTMLLFCFVFFIPLFVIIYCYFFIFKAIKTTNRAVQKIGSDDNKESQKQYQKMKNEWKMAKIALIVILLYVISWSPYSTVALMAFAGYAHVLTPYMNSVPAVIAKASAIHNPIIYAITHPKYRMAIAKYIPCLGFLLKVSRKDSRSYSSYPSTRRSTVTSQSSDVSGLPRGKRLLSSVSDSESGWTDTEADITSMNSRPASRQISFDMGKDTETSDIKGKSKLKSHDSGIFEKHLMDAEDISMVEVNTVERNSPLARKARIRELGMITPVPDALQPTIEGFMLPVVDNLTPRQSVAANPDEWVHRSPDMQVTLSPGVPSTPPFPSGVRVTAKGSIDDKEVSPVAGGNELILGSVFEPGAVGLPEGLTQGAEVLASSVVRASTPRGNHQTSGELKSQQGNQGTMLNLLCPAIPKPTEITMDSIWSAIMVLEKSISSLVDVTSNVMDGAKSREAIGYQAEEQEEILRMDLEVVALELNSCQQTRVDELELKNQISMLISEVWSTDRSGGCLSGQ
ncbi:melanopsin [Rhinatrema bivittatum]|uniref:melanopsin n=1 Tax=Rhinatrema bivittatum TaxID=194408 RepID=UPI00112CC49F|nr:melanopsin [Rhinatrema bivittatum]